MYVAQVDLRRPQGEILDLLGRLLVWGVLIATGVVWIDISIAMLIAGIRRLTG